MKENDIAKMELIANNLMLGSCWEIIMQNIVERVTDPAEARKLVQMLVEFENALGNALGMKTKSLSLEENIKCNIETWESFQRAKQAHTN